MRSIGHDQQKQRSIWYRLNIDVPLLVGILCLLTLGLCVVYSAGGQSADMTIRHAKRIGIALFVMFFVAQIPPLIYRKWAVPAFVVGILLLVAVLLFGHVGKGAQRWLNLGFTMFQPSEIMKLIVPIMIAWYVSQFNLPTKIIHIIAAFTLVLIPTLLIAKQPDLGTSLLIASSGIFVIFLAGASWKLIGTCGILASGFMPVLWLFLMKDYQKQRVLTFLNPEQDPLGSGYHIIQSKIAIGSGGLHGKGYLQGTQSHPELLPESRWYNSITELFRGVDCANPMVDFSGKLIITSADIVEQLDVDKSQWLKVSAVELGRLEGDGAHYIDEIARYQHLHQAYHQACNQAKIDFAHLFKNGEALLEAYTCYPVVPMAFLLVSGLIDTLDEMSSFLAKHTITVTGGMNLARAAWNNPALNALIVMHQRLTNDKESVGLVHGNGGLGYRQGVAIIERVT